MSSVIDEYLEAIRQATSAPGIYAYRGQADSAWPLHSSATRRLLGEARNEDEKKAILQNPDFTINYHRGLIDRARNGGFGIEEGREVTGLQLLAKLQHFRAATGLLDFTRNPLVALWFACEKNDDKDGAIFIVNTNASYVEPISDRNTLNLEAIFSSQSDQTTSTSLQTPTGKRQEAILSSQSDQPGLDLAYLEPTLSGDAKSRILSQRSLFIIGRPLIPESAKIPKIPIEKGDKEQLREDLKRLDFDESTLFRGDIYGFAQVESVASPLSQEPDANHYFIRGNESFQQGKYEDAIADYGKAIDLNSEFAEAYNNRGNAKYRLGRYAEAIEDFNEAIDRDKEFVLAYNNRGLARYSLGQYDEAIEDFNEAIDRDKEFVLAYNNRGLAKGSLGRYEGAIEDFNEAIDRDKEFVLAYNNCGVTKSRLGRHDEAIADFNEAIDRDKDFAEAYNNRGLAKEGLGRYEEAIADYGKAIELRLDFALAYYNRGLANKALNRMDEARNDFEKALPLAVAAGDENLAAGIRKELEALDKG